MRLARQVIPCALALAAACAPAVHIGHRAPGSAQPGAPQPVLHQECADQVSGHRIGVLLPLSGPRRQYGERALAAIQIALRDADLELIVRDTAGDPGRASDAVSDLAERRVTAIIGPLFSAAALAAARKAEELCVPIVSLSHRANLAAVGAWVFRSALTAEAQARALAEVAFRDLGMRRFALLFPRNTYGEEFALAFWDEVNRRHGEIRGVESYNLDDRTFRVPVHKLVGLYQESAPLWPIVDFDAIVVPDTPVRLGTIAATLATADVVLTQDRRRVRRIRRAMDVARVEPVRLLGGSTWNSEGVLDHCATDCEWAVFVDGFFVDDPGVRVRDFVAAFRDQRDGEPELLDAVAFDTAALIRELLSRGASSREAMRAGLLATTHDGLTGKLRFTAGGEAERTLHTLTIRDRAIRSWKRPRR